MIRIFRGIRNEEGATLLELAMVSSIFFAMLIGSFQMMLMLYTFHFVSDAAREGSRYAIVRGSTSCTNTPSLSNCNATADQIQTHIKGLNYPGINPANLSVSTTWLTASITPNALTSGSTTTWSPCTSGTCNAPGNVVKVVAIYSYSFSIPLVPEATWNLTSTSQMVISQ